MELLAVGAHRSLLEDAQQTLRKAGLRLVRTAPSLCSYIELIREEESGLEKRVFNHIKERYT